jgi:oleate hydratase
MLNEETYENFWDLTSRIPSLEVPNISVKDEILAFDHANPTNAQARLIDKDGNRLPVTDMQFDTKDRMKMVKLFFTDEDELDNVTIRDWFDDHSSPPISGICGRPPSPGRNGAASSNFNAI